MQPARWLKRLFSSTVAPSLPAAVQELLQAGAPVQVQKIAGQGRGLVATRDLEYGEVLFREQPYLVTPALSKRKQLCHHCLKVLPTPPSQAAVQAGSHSFCSQTCLAVARASYFLLEPQVNLSHLEGYCEAYAERFPLMAARLALMVAQQAMQPADSASAAGSAHSSSMARFSTGSSSSGVGRSLQASSWMSSSGSSKAMDRLSARSSLEAPAAAGGAVQADPTAPLSFLCFANVPPPPPTPWCEAHSLLLAALEAAADCLEDQQQGLALAAALDSLDIDWYVAVMSRLHLNTFKVDAIFPMDWDNPHAAAAAMMQPDSSSGSALYLLASLYNHSCEPNVNVTFPNNDAVAVFTAARRIAAGEQLHITYTDVEQEADVRREYLAFAYGFTCQCVRCREEGVMATKQDDGQACDDERTGCASATSWAAAENFLAACGGVTPHQDSHDTTHQALYKRHQLQHSPFL